jgi:carboxyvinyl-carboxyphosphonate phosphorylmutase
MFGGSVASLAVLGDPDIALITLTELAEQMRRMSRAAALPVLVDADHGYGNALNVRRTVQELETAGAAGLTIEDTLLPQAFGQTKTQLISLVEGVGKMKAVLGGLSEEAIDPDYLAGKRVRIALQGHAPIAAATLAVYETLKALRDGQSPKNLKGLASSDLTGRVTRDADVKARSAEFLGLKR